MIHYQAEEGGREPQSHLCTDVTVTMQVAVRNIVRLTMIILLSKYHKHSDLSLSRHHTIHWQGVTRHGNRLQRLKFEV